MDLLIDLQYHKAFWPFLGHFLLETLDALLLSINNFIGTQFILIQLPMYKLAAFAISSRIV